MHGAITARIQYDHDDEYGDGPWWFWVLGGGHDGCGDDVGDGGGQGDVCWLLLWGWKSIFSATAQVENFRLNSVYLKTIHKHSSNCFPAHKITPI